MERTQDPRKIQPHPKKTTLNDILKESGEEFIDCLSQIYDLDKESVKKIIKRNDRLHGLQESCNEIIDTKGTE